MFVVRASYGVPTRRLWRPYSYSCTAQSSYCKSALKNFLEQSRLILQKTTAFLRFSQHHCMRFVFHFTCVSKVHISIVFGIIAITTW
jgi:hypothetical protein